MYWREVIKRKNNISVLIRVGISLAIISLFIMVIRFSSYSEDINDGLSNNLLRLHVIANSDSDSDQQLKRLVRDEILEFMRQKLDNSKDIRQTKDFVNKNISTIEDIARKTILKNNKNYSVKAMMGNFPFPTKMYGDVVLPAGDYQALRVVIGAGTGANWWCVLFPPLCFVDATHGTVPDSVKEDLKEVLTDEEYNIITSTDTDEEIPVNVKFKLVEFFQDSKVKFKKILSGL